MTAKNVLITGISRGIGRAICIKLVSEGYQIYGTYNSGAEETAALKVECGSNLQQTFQVDFTQRQQTLAFIEKLSGVTFFAIINNAGIIEFEDFRNMDMSIWDRTLEVNVTTPLLLCQMLQHQVSPGGSIVNIASTDGMIGSFSSMAYSASKAALINLTKSLSNNFGERDVRVNAIAPGWINTGMSTEESFEASSLTPLGRNGKPEDVANVVSFLLSESAAFITGATMVVDGGYTNVDYIMKKEAQQ